MKLIKPSPAAVSYRTLLVHQRHRLVATVAVGWRLRQSGSLLSDQELWRSVPPLTGGAAWDEGWSKHQGEVLVFGSCFAAEPRPVSFVRVCTGGIDKRLAVIGDRVWKDGAFTPPEPFQVMPVSWDRAFGGSTFAMNPRGRGMVEQPGADGSAAIVLPNIEDPGRLIRTPRDRPRPVCLTPIDATWPQRLDLAGSYGSKYLERDFPGFPPDVRPGYFQMALGDQQQPGPFKPDESYLVENMHPSIPSLEGQLPGIVARIFVQRRATPAQLDGVVGRLDTVVLFPAEELGILLFRGLFDIQEDDAADVFGLFVGLEQLASPRADEHYAHSFLRRLDKDQSIFSALDEADLLPQGAPPEPPIIRMDELDAREHELQRARVFAEVRRQLGDDAEHLPPLPEPPPVPTDPEELSAWADAQLEDLPTSREQMWQRAQDAVGSMIPEEPPPEVGAGPPVPMADSLLAQIEATQPDRVSTADERARLEEALRSADAQALALYRDAAHLGPPAPLRSPDEARDGVARVRRSTNGGTNDPLDLTGCDLSGVEAPGAVLANALMESVLLRGARLDEANMRAAVLAHADLSGAQLRRADLARANLGAARLHETHFDGAYLHSVVFDRARLTDCSFVQADLEGSSWLDASVVSADFTSARLPEITLMNLDLSRCRFTGALLRRGTFLEVRLSNVDFSGADLHTVTFMSVVADGASFRGANAGNLHAVSGCSFVGVDFRNADLSGAFLRGADLSGADFTGARMSGVDLSECNLRGAKLTRAHMRDARLVRSELTEVDASGADLMNAVAQKAVFDGAKFARANLFGANLGQVRLDQRTDLQSANLKRVLVHPVRQRAAGEEHDQG